MNKRCFFAFCVLVLLIVPIQVQAKAEFTYDKNTFIKYYECLGVYPGTSLALEEKVWIFSSGLAPMTGKVIHVIPAAQAQKKFDSLGFDSVRRDKPLWGEIGCVHSFRGDMPESLARVTPEPEGSLGVGFAIRGLPADAWIATGNGGSVAMELKDNPYVGLVRHLVTDSCYVPDALVRARHFPVKKGRAIVQLDIGKVKKVSPEKRRQNIEEEMRRAEEVYAKWAWPEYKKKKLEELERKDFVESVEIRRFFLDEKLVIKAEKISRRTGVDERVDTAPDLNTDNWADTTSSVIGFISLNQGKDWDVLLVDWGWEGINYTIQRLDGSMIYYDRSLYTHH